MVGYNCSDWSVNDMSIKNQHPNLSILCDVTQPGKKDLPEV